MSPITFSTELDPTELPTMVRQMASIVGWKTWERRINGLKSELSANPLWEAFVLERHGLELAFGDVHRHLRATGRCPWPPRTAEEYRLYSFLAVAVQLYPRLASNGQARLAGAIRSSLEKDFGLGPLAFEMKVAAHLMSRGFEVEFHDLESGGGYDFLAKSESTKLEVECKHISADIGRQIHRRKLYELGGVLFPVIAQAVDRGGEGRLVQVTLPGRLTSSKEQQQALMERIRAVLSGAVSEVDDSVCAVSSSTFSLAASPFSRGRGHRLTMADVTDYLKQAFNIENANVLLNWRPGHAAVIVFFRSTKPDKVLDTVFKRLKADARQQFSGNLPAFLCVHLADLTHEQLLDLANAERAGTVTGIQRAVSIILQIRPHVHSIGVMADGEVRITQERSANRVHTSVQEVGPSYVFRNPAHPLAKEPSLDRVFV